MSDIILSLASRPPLFSFFPFVFCKSETMRARGESYSELLLSQEVVNVKGSLTPKQASNLQELITLSLYLWLPSTFYYLAVCSLSLSPFYNTITSFRRGIHRERRKHGYACSLAESENELATANNLRHIHRESQVTHTHPLSLHLLTSLACSGGGEAVAVSSCPLSPSIKSSLSAPTLLLPLPPHYITHNNNNNAIRFNCDNCMLSCSIFISHCYYC